MDQSLVPSASSSSPIVATALGLSCSASTDSLFSAASTWSVGEPVESLSGAIPPSGGVDCPTSAICRSITAMRVSRSAAGMMRYKELHSSEVVKYSLAYINPRTCGVDNGRVLGYDNSHDYDHRHFMVEVEEVEFPGYEALVDRFQKEVEDLWRAEDEQEH